MTMDLDIIKKVYTGLTARHQTIRQKLQRPLTLAEKILFSHFDGEWKDAPQRGETYVNLKPDRVAMQDATAQMALLQFMQAGRKTVAVPSTVHCDHLIRAEVNAESDLNTALGENKEVFDFLQSVSKKYGIGFWKPGAGIIPPGGFGKLCISGWYDDRHGLTYAKRGWYGNGCHWCWRRRCC
jgi:aconitate hydratase